jgi:hypothetical protein
MADNPPRTPLNNEESKRVIGRSATNIFNHGRLCQNGSVPNGPKSRSQQGKIPAKLQVVSRQ